jgi:hypothetical protein
MAGEADRQEGTGRLGMETARQSWIEKARGGDSEETTREKDSKVGRQPRRETAAKETVRRRERETGWKIGKGDRKGG